MDMVLLIVLILLAGFGLHGYIRGLIRVVFSLAAVFLTIGLASAVSPHMAEFLRTQTPLYDTIREKCTDYMKQQAEGKRLQGKEENADADQEETQTGLEAFFGKSGVPEEMQGILSGVMQKGVSSIVEDAGIYERIGEFVAENVLQKAAWVLSFALVLIVLEILIRVLDLLSKLPVLDRINRVGGLAAGLIEGLIVVWILFFVIALCQGNEVGKQMMEEIQGNVFLKVLYQYNPLEHFIS